MKKKWWIGASPETVLAVLIIAIVVPVSVSWTINSSHLLESASVNVIHVSEPSDPYADNTYSDVEVAVDNQGSAAAEGCLVRAVGSPPSSEDPADGVTLAESEPFDLSPRDGRVVTLSIYLPDARGKKLAFGTVCENARPAENA